MYKYTYICVCLTAVSHQENLGTLGELNVGLYNNTPKRITFSILRARSHNSRFCHRKITSGSACYVNIV